MGTASGTRTLLPRRAASQTGPGRQVQQAFVGLVSVLVTACGGVLNPPIPTPTPLPTIPPTRTPVPPTETPVPEQWVKNHRLTTIWSGPAGDRTAISFGETSHTFCVFRVEHTEDDARIYVYNPYSDGRFWIDVEAVGPVQPPVRLRGPKPPDQNCAEAVYDPLVGTPVTTTPTTPPTPLPPGTPSAPRATGPRAAP